MDKVTCIVNVEGMTEEYILTIIKLFSNLKDTQVSRDGKNIHVETTSDIKDILKNCSKYDMWYLMA